LPHERYSAGRVASLEVDYAKKVERIGFLRMVAQDSRIVPGGLIEPAASVQGRRMLKRLA
jgi:hypothetical protein